MIELKHISKTFPGVQALKDVSLNIAGGEILAIVGENGAGKSTLMKVLAGIYPANSIEGTIQVNGKPVLFRGVGDAEEAGIVLIPQELQIVPEMTVAENVFLNHEPFFVDALDIAERADVLLERFGVHLDPLQPIKRFGVGQQQLVMLSRALVRDARTVIFDEPTAALGGHEVASLFHVIRVLRDSGVACVFVSHRIDEVLAIADRVAVMRNGQLIKELRAAGATVAQIVELMVGRSLGEMYRRTRPAIGEPVLTVRDFSVASPSNPNRLVVSHVKLEVAAGEIVGLFGLVGAGRTEFVSALMGAWRGARSGEVLIKGRPVDINSPQDAIRAGMALLTEDRRRLGLFLNMNVAENVNVGSLEDVSHLQVIDEDAGLARAGRLGSQLRIKTPSMLAPVATLSGGNQQKVIIARLLAMHPVVLLLDEPTRGVDVGAKAEIFALLNELTGRGLGILLVSSESLEVLGMSDRILVLYKGMITASFGRGEATERSLLEAATGGATVSAAGT